MKKSILLIFWLVLAAWPAAAGAHGGGTPQIVREPAGPFLISVWTLPDPLAVGEVNFVVLVTSDAQGGIDDYVLDADVRLRLTNRRTGETIDAVATHEQATNTLFYESYFELPAGGSWEAEVAVVSGDQSGAATFSVDVAGEGTAINWPLYGGIGVAAIGVLWFALQARRRE